MPPEENNDKPENDPNDGRVVRSVNLWVLLLLIAIGVIIISPWFSTKRSQISMYYLEKLIAGKDFTGNVVRDANNEPIKGTNIESIMMFDSYAEGTFVTVPAIEPSRDSDGAIKTDELDQRLEKHFVVNIPPDNSNERADLLTLLRKHDVQFDIAPKQDWGGFVSVLLFVFMLGIVLLMFLSMRRSQNQMMGGGFLSGFSRSPAKQFEADDKATTFKDVAGIEGVKADLMEIVEFLRDPTKFQKLGGRVPKGVLLVGPPGTGKTLLARAVAGEASVPFYSVNGSEFIQMFVGVGASRVRDLFNNAKTNAPAIIFVDEIDAVGRQRGAGLGGGHDEREQTLNQILGEMDGFAGTESVIVLAATNRPDILDPALLRPGRFDRHITVSRPTLNGRLAIFKVHVRKVPLGENVDLKMLASATAGMTGADIANLINEAALWAARQEKTSVEMSDFYYAHDKVLMGAKREEILSNREKERTAYHEAGHTIAAWFLDGAHPVHKVTIIPRGRALGVTQMVPDEDRMNLSELELRDQLIVLLAGRAAEKLIYDEFTVGAENDLERATSLSRRMVTHWGMSERLGPVSYKMMDEDPFLGREIHQGRQFSEHTMEVIDEEVTKILQDAARKAFNLLGDHHDDLRTLTDALLVDEELDQKDIRKLLGASIHDKKPSKIKDTPDEDAVPSSNGEIDQETTPSKSDTTS